MTSKRHRNVYEDGGKGPLVVDEVQEWYARFGPKSRAKGSKPRRAAQDQ